MDGKRAENIKRRAHRLVEDLNPEEMMYFLKCFLKEFFMLPLKVGTYQRVQDDCDGDLTQTLDVGCGPEGDMYIWTGDKELRFRTRNGGGGSLFTWAALRVLVCAILFDSRDEEGG